MDPSTDSPTVGVFQPEWLEGFAQRHRWLVVFDAERRIVWKSEALSELPGLESLRLGQDGRTLISALPSPGQLFALRASLRPGSTLRGVPVALRTPDGGSLWISLDLIRIGSGAGEHLLAIVDKLADASSDGPEAELLDAVDAAVVSIDAEGLLRHANSGARALLGDTVPDSEGQALLERLAVEFDVESLEGALREPAEAGSTGCQIRERAGAGRVFVVQVRPLAEGRRALIFRDLLRSDAEASSLRRQKEELERCIGVLAHDLRSPLTGLLGFSDLLHQDYAKALGDSGRHFLARIQQSARTMDALIEEVLALVRIGKSQKAPQWVDPGELLGQLAAEWKPRLDAAGIALQIPRVQSSRVYCARTQLYQVMSNLIGNAVEHMGDGPDLQIRVEVIEDDAGHEIVVSDTGRGIASEDRERIFEIFQTAASPGAGRKGTGMGLAIVKKIVENYQGRVWEDAPPGAGARFHVWFPRA